MFFEGRVNEYFIRRFKTFPYVLPYASQCRRARNSNIVEWVVDCGTIFIAYLAGVTKRDLASAELCFVCNDAAAIYAA